MIKKITVLLFVFCISFIDAQQSNTSPYSAFGLGDMHSEKTVEQSSMGGIGVAMQESNRLNFVNPAAVAGLRFASYALAGKATFLTLEDKTSSKRSNTSGLSYIALGLPIGKKAGISVGLQPLSSVGYSFLSTNESNGSVTDMSLFEGKGGVNKLYGNLGMVIYKGLSVGVEGAFVFGNIENVIVNKTTGASLSSKYISNSTVRGGMFKLGAQYKTLLDDKITIKSGLALKLKSELSKRGTEKMYSLMYDGEGRELTRQILFNRGFKNSLKVPTSLVAGLGAGVENKWYLGVNTEIQNAITDQKNTSFKYENSFRTSIGGFYIPKINSISSYWDRVVYRGGVRFEKLGLAVDGLGLGQKFTPINDFGINLGLGLPLPKQMSNLNLGLEYGQRGTIDNNLIKESYFNVRLGLSLNSINWFRKREID